MTEEDSVPEDGRGARLEAEAIIIGYAMSRMGSEYLSARGLPTWRQAFAEAAQSLAIKPSSIKNLRQEFDPFHTGRGWRNRPMRPSRQRVLDHLHEVSDDALLELTARILRREQAALAEVLDVLTEAAKPVVANVAERLLTGRLAEEYFLAHCRQLIQVEREALLDLRQSAGGFDFGVRHQPERAIEVKGLKPLQGGILFTDREWKEARSRRDDYWLVVVGNLAAVQPAARVIRDPYTVLDARLTQRQTLEMLWRSTVSVQTL